MDRILLRRDHLGQYDDVSFLIDGKTYSARVAGHDVWHLAWYPKSGGKRTLTPKRNEQVRAVMKALLEADELAVMRDAG